MAEDSRPARGPMRVLLFALGWIFVAVGAVGVVVPGLPTTGPLILAASCFARSSPRFERMILELPGVGPMVRDYRSGLGMPRRAKLAAITMIVVAVAASTIFGVSRTPVRVVIIVVGLIGVWFVGVRVPTTERVLAARGEASDTQ